MSTTEQTAFDPRPLLRQAFDLVGRLVDGTDPADSDRRTPCEDWPVGRLVGHLQAVVRRIDAVLSGRPFFSVPRELESSDWAGDWARGRALAEAALADDAVLARIVTVPWGEVSGAAAGASYIGELAVHAWDLAVATGRTDELDDHLAKVALAAYQEKVPAQPRGGDIPFGPVVETGPDATAYEQLVAWTGRDPHWRP